MINFTRCAFMAKQACATFSQVVQKITPPVANNFLKFFFALFATLTLNAATAWAEELEVIQTLSLSASKTINATPISVGDVLSITGTKGTSNFPVFNYNATKGVDLRFYQGTTCSVTFTAEEGYKLEQIVFKKNTSTASTLSKISVNNGTLSSNVWTASGSTESVTFTYNNSSNFKEQIYKIYVTYSSTSSGGGSTPDPEDPTPETGDGTWTLVTNASDLKAGDIVVIASNTKGVVASDITSDYMGQVNATFSADKSTITTLPSGAVQLTVGGTAGAWTLTYNGKQLGATALKKVAWASGTKTWSISISNNNATIQNGTSSYGRFLHNVNSTRFTTYTSDVNTSMLLPQIYKKNTALTDCDNAVTISQGTLSNGSFKLDKTGEQSTCNGAVTVTLSDIQPADGYQFSTITQSGVDDAKVTIDNVAKTVTYAQNTTGESTINVTFTPIEYTLELESTLSCVTNGSATIAYNATSAKTFTAATRDDYTCTGYWNAPSGGVQVLKADGTFVGDVSGFISGGKWVNTTATKLTPRWETEYKMILSKGTEENGTYTLSPTNIETSSCATSTTRQVTITATPVVGYEVDQITYSGEGTATIKTGPTISAGKTTWVYTFDENDKGLGTFIVTFKQLPTYTVTWMANEQQHAAQTAAVGTSLTNPGDPEASTYACDDKVFVGWTAEKNYSNTTTAPDDLFKSAEATSKTIPENGITYCAVFANATTIPGTTTTTEETATLSFADAAQRTNISSTQQVWKQNGIVFTNNQAGSSTPVADYVNPVRCYKGSNIILDCSELGNIANVQFKCDDSEHAGNLATSIGSEASTTTTLVTLIPKSKTTVYEISLSSGQTRISSLIVTYEKTIVSDPTVTYSNYSTTCVPAPKLVSIAQTAGQIEFTEGDEFVKATITATYEDESTKDVTSKATFSTPDMTQVGEQTISVSYKEGEVTAETSYKINIKEKTKYTITWWANGEEFYTQTDVEGTTIEVPTTSPEAATYACDDKAFVGWVDTEIIVSTDTKPTLITDFDKITENKDFFAVFASESSTDHPTAYTAGEVGNFVLAAKNGDKWYALPTNPVVNSGKIQGVEIPVTTTNGVEHVTTANASGYTWTIANATNGQTISDGSKYIYHKNGGESGTDLACGTGTTYTWKIEEESEGLTFKAMNGSSVNSRGMLVQGTQYGGYSLSNETTNGYYRISVLPIADAVSYSGYVTTCEATTEALSGTFSVGKYEVAQFATGNLQYKPSTATWRFAKQQYQVVGEDNINVGDPNYKGWIDMLGWSNGDANKFGVNPSCDKNLYIGEFVDWGTKMGEGWLTLSDSQWDYLLNKRPNHSKLKQIAMVGETRGIMLFPDDWTETTVDATDDAELGVNVYKYDLTQWTALEAAGAVFLPAAGRRFGGYGNTYGVDGLTDKGEEYKIQYKTNYFACYWTSTKHSDGEKVSYLFNYAVNGSSYKYSNLNLGWYEYGHAGHSVRLAKVTSTLIEIGGGDNSDVITANEGKVVNVKVNRTFKANDGYYTLCLPFDLAAEKIGNVLQISSITENVAEQGMNVVFAPVEILEAGQPYLLLPSKNIENPIFEGVTIVNTTGETTEPVSGAGIKITLTGIINGGGQTDGSTEYYVGDHGYLYNGSTAKLGLRAFFTITDDADQPVKVRARVVVGENTTTGVDNSQLPITNIQKVIENGQLIIIRNGEKFNAQGQKL